MMNHLIAFGMNATLSGIECIQNYIQLKSTLSQGSVHINNSDLPTPPAIGLNYNRVIATINSTEVEYLRKCGFYQRLRSSMSQQ